VPRRRSALLISTLISALGLQLVAIGPVLAAPALPGSTGNDGAYADSVSARKSATYSYRVCEAGTQTCSNEASVTT